MTWVELDRLRAALFARARAPLYALVDGARSPRVFPLVRDSQLPNACLYDGRLIPRLAAAAPYLVRLELEAPFVADLIAHGWTNAWGLFLESRAPLDELRAHLRTLLRVRDPSGQVLLFRFYDPRVLRLYAPTCNRDEAQQLFGPISQFLLEGAGGDLLSLMPPGRGGGS